MGTEVNEEELPVMLLEEEKLIVTVLAAHWQESSVEVISVL